MKGSQLEEEDGLVSLPSKQLGSDLKEPGFSDLDLKTGFAEI